MPKKQLRNCALVTSILLGASLLLLSQTSTPVPNAKAFPVAVPVIDGGIGSCSADVTVTDASGAPVYAANVTVHIAYGFMNIRKLDLELGTKPTARPASPACPAASSMASTSALPRAIAAAKPSTIPPTPARRSSRLRY